jgi:hypothetical protein
MSAAEKAWLKEVEAFAKDLVQLMTMAYEAGVNDLPPKEAFARTQSLSMEIGQRFAEKAAALAVMIGEAG